jgi:hypothetical protein
MAEIETRIDDQAEKTEDTAAFSRADLVCPFGPSFFLGYLERFVRDHCPDPTEKLPGVQVHLANGETLDLCHIIGVSPRWVMMAVRDTASHSDGMAIELVPFERIQGVRIGTPHAEGPFVGFVQSRTPDIIDVEALLRAAMSPGDSVAAKDNRSTQTRPEETR